MLYSTAALPKTEYVPVARNYYALRSEWLKMADKARHLDICACVAKRRKNPIFAGQSAAAMYGIPWLGFYEMRPHCFSEKTKGTDFIRWYHGKYDPKARMLGSNLVVGPIQTICDMAKNQSPESDIPRRI
jgi:hypothetical protein